MLRFRSLESISFDPEIERSLSQILKKKATMVGVIDFDPISNLMEPMAFLSKKLGQFNVSSIQTNVVCIDCAANHPSVERQVGNPFAQSDAE